MKKNALLALLALTISANVFAGDFTTAGDGTTWTMAKLAETQGSGVTKSDNAFTLANRVLIAKGDKFELEGGITLMFDKGISLEIEGIANLDVPANQRVLITRSAEGVVPGVFYMKSDDAVTTVKNIDFEYVGLKNFGEKGLVVDSCTFRYHAASTANGSSAINMGGSGAEFEVRNTIFEKNERSGVGGAANASNPVVIENCQFLYNGTNNRNFPQVNLTAATQVVVRNCVVLGDRNKMRVGGIVVSNLLGAAQDAHLLIEGCLVMDSSYGISIYSDQIATVRNNILINNDCIANPNQGGSGLNVTDANSAQVTKFSGNFIMGSFWGASIIGGKDINFGRIDVPEDSEDYNIGQNVFFNNGTDGKTYDLYNNSPNTVYAQNNFWLTAASFNPEAVDDCIVDKSDDASLGEVIYKTAGMATVPTSISSNVQQVMKGVQAVYNMLGVRSEEMHKGLNIVAKDGKVVKVVK